jgi:membrane-bound metal-dependent hydrolase YbcI (DUF457 family)
MDTVTHGLVGALIGKAFFAEDPPTAGASWLDRPRTEDRVAILAATLGAIFPDVDVIAPLLSSDNLAFLTLHRGVTHSLLMLPLWASGLALLAAWLARQIRWPAPELATLVSIFGAGLAAHIFLDLVTSWGTMAWSPLDHTRLSWDTVFILDLSVTSAALVPQLAAWVHRRADRAVWFAVGLWLLLSAAAFALIPWLSSLEVPLSRTAVTGASLIFAVFLLVPLRHRGKSRFGRQIWCRLGLALLAGYFTFAAGMHYLAFDRVRQFAIDGNLNYRNIAALPLPPSPARWAGLIATPDRVYRVQFNLLGGENVRFETYRDAAPNRFVIAARALPQVQTFLWFARFPVFSYSEREGQSVVRISDLRFLGPRRPVVTEQTPLTNFSYEVVFSPDGAVISSGPLAND